MTQTKRNYRLPFDLPPTAQYQVAIDPNEFGAMMAGEDIEIEAAEMMAAEWTVRADNHDPEQQPVFGIMLPRRYGMTARESKILSNDSAHVRAISLRLFELIDRIATECPDQSVEDVHGDVMGFGSSRYLPPYIRPYLDDLMSLDGEGTQTYGERQCTVYLQRAMPDWTIQHTLALRSGMVRAMLEFARLEDEGAVEPKKIAPEAT